MTDDVELLIKLLPQNQKDQLLFEYGSKDEHFRENILNRIPPDSLWLIGDCLFDNWESKIKEVIEAEVQASRESDLRDESFFDWHNTFNFLKVAVSNLLKKGEPEKAYELINRTEEILRGYPLYAMSYFYFEETEKSCRDILDDLKTQIVRADPTQKKKFFEECIQSALKGELRTVWLRKFSSLEDQKVQLSAIKKYLALVHEERPRRDPPTKYLNYAFDLMESLNPDEVQDFFSRYQGIYSVRQRLEIWHINRGEFVHYLNFLREDVRKEPKNVRKTKMLVRLAELLYKPDILRGVIIDRFKDSIKWDVELFDAFQNCLTSEEWTALAEREIHETQNSPVLRANLCIKLGRLEEARLITRRAIQKTKLRGLNGNSREKFFKEFLPQVTKLLGPRDLGLLDSWVFDKLKDVFALPMSCREYDSLAELLKLFLTTEEKKLRFRTLLQTILIEQTKSLNREFMKSEFRRVGFL